MTTNTIIEGDVRTELGRLAENSVDCVITSPPYFRLRNYAHSNQIGLEDHIDGWVKQLATVMNDVARVLKPTGSLWLNLGDSYSRTNNAGAPPKSLLLGPERLLLALSANGWIVRNKIVWAKTNPMPASVKDRLATKHEYIYFLTRNPNYHFDLDAIRTPHKTKHRPKIAKTSASSAAYPPTVVSAPEWAGPHANNNSGLIAMRQHGWTAHPKGKNPGDVWAMATANYRGAHFATFPTQLVEPPLLATCPKRVCKGCGKPWTTTTAKVGQLAINQKLDPACRCKTGWKPGLVLDPFFGAGTVGLVAEQHSRRWLGIELNHQFVDLATRRIQQARTTTANASK